MQGRSLRPLLEGKTNLIHDENDPIGYEVIGNGNSALFLGDWKILKLKPPFGDGEWKLFNISEDPRELNDLSKKYPERLAKMISLYDAYEKDKGVVPIERLYDAECQCYPE
jgi:arylsulfatase A-like enzyme